MSLAAAVDIPDPGGFTDSVFRLLYSCRVSVNITAPIGIREVDRGEAFELLLGLVRRDPANLSIGRLIV